MTSEYNTTFCSALRQPDSETGQTNAHEIGQIGGENMLAPAAHQFPSLYYGLPSAHPHSFTEREAANSQLCLPLACSTAEQFHIPANFTSSQSNLVPLQPQTYGDGFPGSYYNSNINVSNGVLQPQAMLSNQVRDLYAGSAQFPRIVESAPSLSSSHHPSDTESIKSPSPVESSPYMSWISDRSVPSTPLSTHSTFLPSDEEEDTDSRDKPYARLIWEALMQAPGHRMPLRDIYAWFQQNTRKPQESGTNGWQNSIRHNLSMNQAFENDKSEMVYGSSSKKANSIWMLTECAIQSGVQSTTRYRKAGSSKKYAPSKIPAVQRQRSGARGGRAASRAARLRKQEEIQRVTNSLHTITSVKTPPTSNTSSISTAPDRWSVCDYSPLTPIDDQLFDPAHQSLQSQPPLYHYGPTSEPKLDVNGVSEQGQMFLQERSDQPLPDVFFKKILYY